MFSRVGTDREVDDPGRGVILGFPPLTILPERSTVGRAGDDRLLSLGGGGCGWKGTTSTREGTEPGLFGDEKDEDEDAGG